MGELPGLQNNYENCRSNSLWLLIWYRDRLSKIIKFLKQIKTIKLIAYLDFDLFCRRQRSEQ